MKKIILIPVALLMFGCAHEMPTGEAFKTTEQLKLNSASHWDVLAHHEAGMIKKTLEKSSKLPVFIKEPDKSFPFAKAYHNLLTSSLASEGVTIVTQQASSAATINYVVDVIEHSARYRENKALAKPLAKGVYYLAASALGKGVYDVTTTAMEVVKAPFYAVGGQIAPDFSTPAEVVITTQIVMGKQVLNSDSRVYYVDKRNLAHYSQRAPIPFPHHFTVTDHE